MRMNAPGFDQNGHFLWWLLDEDSLPDIVTCPAANRDLLFTQNPEIDPGNLESFVFQYAAFYMSPQTIRCGTPLRPSDTTHGGTNPYIPNPSQDSNSATLHSNFNNGGTGYGSGQYVPCVWVLPEGT